MKIKICGLGRKEDVDYVNLWKPDFVGFVFAGKKRKIDFDTAKRLRSKLAFGIKTVGVFVNEEPAYIVSLAAEHIIDMVQLHGDEDVLYIQTLRESLQKNGKADIPIIKAVRVKSSEQVLAAERLPVDYLLLDTFTGDEYGGSGKVFDHSLIPEIKKPYFLAGGIDSENVIEIINYMKRKNVTLPFCIDVSSSVETDGYKDEAKIKGIISLVQAI